MIQRFRSVSSLPKYLKRWMNTRKRSQRRSSKPSEMSGGTQQGISGLSTRLPDQTSGSDIRPDGLLRTQPGRARDRRGPQQGSLPSDSSARKWARDQERNRQNIRQYSEIRSYCAGGNESDSRTGKEDSGGDSKMTLEELNTLSVRQGSRSPWITS